MESSIRRTVDDDATTVTVRGEIDFANADELAACFRDAVTVGSPMLVRVDLRAATFIDSTGLGALIEGYRVTTETGARFLVVNPSAAFRRVLIVTGLSDFFGVTGTELDEDAAAPSRASGA